MNSISTLSRELRQRLDTITARAARDAFSSDIRIAKTWSDTEATYPAKPANVYGIVFLDANQNRTEHSTTVKQYAYHLSNTNCYIPRGTTVAVVFINSQWWIVHCHRLKNEEPEFEPIIAPMSFLYAEFSRHTKIVPGNLSTSTWRDELEHLIENPDGEAPSYGRLSVGSLTIVDPFPIPGVDPLYSAFVATKITPTFPAAVMQNATRLYLYAGRDDQYSAQFPARLNRERRVLVGIRPAGDPYSIFTGPPDDDNPYGVHFETDHITLVMGATATALGAGNEEILEWDVTPHLEYMRANGSEVAWYFFPEESWRYDESETDSDLVRSKKTQVAAGLGYPDSADPFFRYTTDPVP